MFGSLPLEGVRKQHDEPTGPQPLGLARSDELVDDALPPIREITELRFPQHQGLWVGKRIAIFEAKHPEFTERAVAHFEASAFDIGQWDIFLARLLVDPHRVALAERAAATVLARQAHAVPLGEQAAEGE